MGRDKAPCCGCVISTVAMAVDALDACDCQCHDSAKQFARVSDVGLER
jgi:hypothetical protein